MLGGYVEATAQELHHSAERQKPDKPVQPLLSLTARQEDRLRAHLEDRFRQLDSDERTHSFGSLSQLVSRLLPLLYLVLQIPPVEPWAALRISYLLNLTGGLPAYITQLSLVEVADPLATDEELDDGGSVVSSETSSAMRQAETTLRRLLHLLQEVDRGWVVVLSGEAWVVEHGRGRAEKVRFAGQVGATERIRLRSIIISARQRLIAWARQYGDFKGDALPIQGDQPAEVHDEGASSVNGEDWDWEMEIRRMWNRTAELLTDLDEEA